MIDTIKLSYPVDDTLINLFGSYAERIQKLSAAGEILWEKSYCQTSIPSSFSGLRVTVQNAKEMQSQGFKVARSLIFFEFSLQKWQSDTGYNEKNTSMEEDCCALAEWIDLLSSVFKYNFESENFELYRVDLSTNYILEKGSVPEFLRSLELKFSRHENGEKNLMRFPGAIQYGSRWIAKKLYYKLAEFHQGYYKQKADLYRQLAEGVDMEKIRVLNGGKRLLTEDEQIKLARTLRFEVEFRRMFLKKHNITKIVNLSELVVRFDKEKKHYLTAKKISEVTNLSGAEYQVVDLCKRYGATVAKQEFLRTKKERYWYKVKKQLQAKDIFIESITNEYYRLEIEKADCLKEFTLSVA